MLPWTPHGSLLTLTTYSLHPWDDGQQIHSVVTHVIDRDGRFAAKFHELKFGRVNMVLYINGLINNWYTTEAHSTQNL